MAGDIAASKYPPSQQKNSNEKVLEGQARSRVDARLSQVGRKRKKRQQQQGQNPHISISLLLFHLSFSRKIGKRRKREQISFFFRQRDIYGRWKTGLPGGIFYRLHIWAKKNVNTIAAIHKFLESMLRLLKVLAYEGLVGLFPILATLIWKILETRRGEASPILSLFFLLLNHNFLSPPPSSLHTLKKYNTVELRQLCLDQQDNCDQHFRRGPPLPQGAICGHFGGKEGEGGGSSD